MAVKGIEIEVGQRWALADGVTHVVVVEHDNTDPELPWRVEPCWDPHRTYPRDVNWRTDCGAVPGASMRDLSLWTLVACSRPPTTPEPTLKKPAPSAPGILAAAARHMHDRAATYDKPQGERSMAQTVAIFNLFHGTAISETQGWHFMQILKDVRLFSNISAPHRDSIDDGVAYAALKGESLLKGSK